MKKQTEYENFDRTMTELLTVSHSEIKAKLDAERAAKKNRPTGKQNDNRNENDHTSK